MKAAVVAAMLAAAVPAAAQPAPATVPTHDVSISYRLEGEARDMVPGGLGDAVRLQWSAGTRRLRVEPQGRSQVLLLDLAAPRLEVLDTGLHGVITLPVRVQDVGPLTLQETRLTKRGTAVVAGLACTEYDVAAKRGQGRVCLTADGIALRGNGTVDGRRGSFVALDVQSAPVPDAAFAVPPGYMRLAIPGLGRF